LLAFLVALSTLAAAGDIQVACAPGLQVYLDGNLVGTSSVKEDGLYLVGVAAGGHTIRVEKEGFAPQSFQVEAFDVPLEVKVGELVPLPVTSPGREVDPPEVRELVGSLVITSAPQNCVVEIDGRSETKTSPQLQLGALAPGEHTIAFSKPGYERISGVVKVQPGAELTVRGNLVAGRVEVSHQGKGSLRVISSPMRCTVRFRGSTFEKDHPKLNLSHIPAGEHDLVVSLAGRTLSSKVLVNDGQRTVVVFSFMPGDEPVVVTHEPE
jgi:hypothetical protein